MRVEWNVDNMKMSIAKNVQERVSYVRRNVEKCKGSLKLNPLVSLIINNLDFLKMEMKGKEQVYQSGSSDSLNQPAENESQHQQINYDDEQAPEDCNLSDDEDNDLEEDFDDDGLDDEDSMGRGGERWRKENK